MKLPPVPRFGSWLPLVLAVLCAAVLLPASMTIRAERVSNAGMATCQHLRREALPADREEPPAGHRGAPCKNCTAPFLGTPFA
ncbi:MAG TPA: hypothetical protein VFP37_00455 [Steroidobacteraceae bacterium]|nr:hypothetical protein [Steroidobacteraceae bacterium]